MPSNYVISIILKAVTGDAQKQLRGVVQEMSTFEKIATAAIGGLVSYQALQLVNQLNDLADWAAANMEVANSFKRLADRYDLDSDRIVSALKRASKGTVAEQDLIVQANKAMRLGVATTVEEFEQLMKVAYVRAKEFGISVAEAWEYIVVGIGRASPMILDNIGILMDSERTFKDYAASIGKAANELTVFEKKAAIRSRILAESAQDLTDWAELEGSAADEIARANAEMEEAKLKIGELAAVLKGKLAVELVNVAEDAGETTRMLMELSRVAGLQATPDIRGLQHEFKELNVVGESVKASGWAQHLGQGLVQLADASNLASKSQAELGKTVTEASKAADRAEDIWHDYMRDVAEENWRFTQRMEDMFFRQTQAAEDAAYRLYEIERDAAQRTDDLWTQYFMDEEDDWRRHQMEMRWMTQDYLDDLRDMEWEYQHTKKEMLDKAPWWIRQALKDEFRERAKIAKTGDKDALREYDKYLLKRIKAIDPAYAKELKKLQQQYEHERKIKEREREQEKARKEEEYAEDRRSEKRQLERQLRILERELADQRDAWRFHDQQRLENEQWAMDQLIAENKHSLETMWSDTDYQLSQLPPLYKHYGYQSWMQWVQGFTDAQGDFPVPGVNLDVSGINIGSPDVIDALSERLLDMLGSKILNQLR